MALIVVLAVALFLAAVLLALALFVGRRVQITEEDLERNEKLPLMMMQHRNYHWTLPTLEEDFIGRMLPALIWSCREDARRVLEAPVSASAYVYLALVYVLVAGMEVGLRVGRWGPVRRRLTGWEKPLIYALSGLLVSASRYRRA